MPIKIAIIGAGSIGFTRKLMADILAVPELADTTFHFMDISQRNLEMIAQLAARDIAANQLPATIETTLSQREAITDSDYVISVIRQGGLEAFALDIDIPLQYGVDQCVGDTICAGGIMYAQRTIPVLLNICRDIREVAHRDCLFLNYTNPMAMNVWACHKYGRVPTIGLCHGVQHGHKMIADCIELWARNENIIEPHETVTPSEVDIICAGINHQTWYTQIQWRGMDIVPQLAQMMAGHPQYAREEKVRLDVLRRFGYFSTESNGHLSEYVPWYRKRPSEIPQWIDLSHWIHGETGGYLRVCREDRHWFEADFPHWLAQDPPVIAYDHRSDEHGSYIIESLETGRPYRGHFNVVNQGHITNLPDGCVVEIPGYVDRNGVNMPVVGDLPLACAATCAHSVRVQEMAMEAAVHGDVTLLKQALLHDPLVGAVCNPEEVWQMADDLLIAQAEWLPQYAADIPAAQARLAAATANGSRVQLSTTNGAARLPTRSVIEMQQDAALAHPQADSLNEGN